MKEEFDFERIKNKAIEQLKGFPEAIQSVYPDTALEKLVYLAYYNIRKK